MTSKGIEFENEIIEAEYTFLAEKVARLQDKVSNFFPELQLSNKIFGFLFLEHQKTNMVCYHAS